MAHKWCAIIIIFFTCLTVFTVVLLVALKFLILSPTASDTGTTIATTTTIDGSIVCKPACRRYQTCVNNVCMIVGSLVIRATWSRVGDGDLIVKTPSGKIIYWMNRGPNSNTDQGEFVSDNTNSTNSEVIFWNRNTAPPTGTYYICTETYSFLPAVSTYNPVTFTVRVRTTTAETHVYTKTMIQNAASYSTCNSNLLSYVTAFQYP